MKTMEDIFYHNFPNRATSFLNYEYGIKQTNTKNAISCEYVRKGKKTILYFRQDFIGWLGSIYFVNLKGKLNKIRSPLVVIEI